MDVDKDTKPAKDSDDKGRDRRSRSRDRDRRDRDRRDRSRNGRDSDKGRDRDSGRDRRNYLLKSQRRKQYRLISSSGGSGRDYRDYDRDVSNEHWIVSVEE